MTIAKMGLLMCDMIDRGMVHYIATTGALMAHGLVDGIGLSHYKYDPRFDDAVLAREKINRVTDTLEPEENFDHVEDVVREALLSFNGAVTISPSVFHREIGRYLAEHFPGKRAVLKSAFERNVPVCVPAFADSEIGNDVYTENKRRQCGDPGEGRRSLIMDMELDTKLLLDMATQSERMAIFSIGGGVPRNNTQNVAPLIEILNARLDLGLRPSQFFYGCRIDPTPLYYGNLSGCSYSEGSSWRKMDLRGRFSEIRADATIVWPFMLAHLMQQG